MIFNKKFFVISLLSVCLMLSCQYFRTDINKYEVKVKFDGGRNGEKLESVNTIIGSDKFWWTSFEAGEEKTVKLISEKNAANNLTLLYTFGGEQRSWESKTFTENADYRINLTVSSTGNVTEDLCQEPCH